MVSGGGTLLKTVDTTGTDGLAEVGAWRLGNSRLAVNFSRGDSRIPAAASHVFRNRHASPRLGVQDRGAVSRR